MKDSQERYNYIPEFSYKGMIFKKKKKEMAVFACWDINKKNITMFLNSFAWSSNGRIGYPLYRKLINAINHEVIHGATQKILEKDRFTGAFNPEFPMLHGMDPDYNRVMKQFE